ncbi:oxidoreductase [Salinirubellus salinus]|uniref:Oxidoreductase n=1 Tax=Salinirubellus salinus TaxID=1364945 RepID=A0A9E7UA73_9EURY|nr:oxidoreductase [Salinirubellus salinus]UWM53943.1 oxidoreductase [Salinirubellus salinus]
MSQWTVADAPDQSGRVAVVTGANSGLGYEVTKGLADLGAEVVMACRSIDRGESARRDLEREVPGASLSVLELDLADLDSVAAFADAFREAHDDLHLLVNNAGVMALPRRETADGFEMQFGTNHLGHFALTGHLLPAIEGADEPRVATMSSGIHERGHIDFDDLQRERDYDKWAAYGQSKLANLLFAYELDRRADAVLSVGAHPGYAATNLQTAGPEMAGSTVRKVAMEAANAVFAQDADDGALPMLYALTMPDVRGGEYYGPGGFMGMRGGPERQRSSERSYDRETARRLWAVSEDLTGVSYLSR